MGLQGQTRGKARKEVSSSCYRLSLEEVDGLLKTIHMTLSIKEARTQLLLHDKLYQTMDEVMLKMVGQRCPEKAIKVLISVYG